MGKSTDLLVCLSLIFSNCYVSVLCDEHNHKYNDREDVLAWIRSVGPYHNQQETYEYFSLPFCAGSKMTINHHQTFIEALQGVKLQFSGYEIEFKVDVPRTIYCMVELWEEHVKAFTNAVINDYWYQMYIDGLPIWGKVGERDETDGKYYIYTHKKFDIGYNGQQIVDITLTTEMREELKSDNKIKFSYEVNWNPSKIDFKNRFDKLDPYFSQYRIPWVRIFYNCTIVIILVALVAMILIRSLQKDYAKFSKEEGVLKAMSGFNTK